MIVRRVGKGPRVVWIHGLGESSVSFEPVIARMPDYTHVLVDLPGYGRSPWPAQVPTLAQLADQLATWLEAEPPAPLVGHSMGGVLATLVAERAQVRAVIDVDGNLSPGDCTFSAEASSYSEDAFCAHGFAELRIGVYEDGVASAELRTYFAALSLASPIAFYRHARELVELSGGGTLAPRLAALRAPTLFVAGVPEGICAASRALLDQHGIRWVGIEPAGHWVYVDQPQRFANELTQFISET